MKHFILVIDNEAVGEIPSKALLASPSEQIKKYVAIISSDPRIIVNEGPVADGSIWDGEKFLPPVE